jgi:hypothetical protein
MSCVERKGGRVVLNQTLIEMMARDRIAELQRSAAKRRCGARCYDDADGTKSDTALAPIERYRRARPRRAIGWFLVSVGLRLALPRARARSAR